MAGTGIDITLTSSANTSGFEATAAAAGKTEWELKQMAEAAKDADLAMSGTWGQKGTQDLDEMAESARRLSIPTDAVNEALRKLDAQQKAASSSSRSMAASLSEAEIKASAGKGVIEGLTVAAKGGEGAFFGLSKAAGAFMQVLNASPVMRIISAVGLLAAGMKLLIDKIVESSTAWEGSLKAMKPIAETYKEIDDAAKASLDDQLKRLSAISEAYEEWGDAVSRARKEVDAINSAQQKLELAKLDKSEADELAGAQTDEQRAEIKNKYESRRTSVRRHYEDIAAENEKLAANQQIKEAEAQLSKIQLERDRIAADVLEKQQAYESALSRSGQAVREGAKNLDEQVRLSMEAKRAYDDALKSQREFDKSATKDEDKAQNEIRSAKAKLDVGAIDKQTRDIERAPKPKPSNNQAEISALNKEAEDAAAAQDWARQDAAVAKLRKLRQPAARPAAVTTYAPTDKAPAASQPGQLPDLATPLRDAAQKAGDSATQSADSIQAAADAAKAVADNTKPIDASALTSALQAAATAQQSAGAQTAAGIQQMVSLAEQQTALARDQASKIATMTTQINSLRVEVGQLRAQVRNAA